MLFKLLEPERQWYCGSNKSVSLHFNVICHWDAIEIMQRHLWFGKQYDHHYLIECHETEIVIWNTHPCLPQHHL